MIKKITHKIINKIINKLQIIYRINYSWFVDIKLNFDRKILRKTRWNKKFYITSNFKNKK
jgi:hypothetical protein